MTLAGLPGIFFREKAASALIHGCVHLGSKGGMERCRGTVASVHTSRSSLVGGKEGKREVIVQCFFLELRWWMGGR